VLAEVLEDASNELTGIARLALQRAHLHWIDWDLQMKWFDERTSAHVRSDECAAKAAALQGAYFSPSWTAFQADRGRDFSVIVDGVSN
jgi:hypothetical protein